MELEKAMEIGIKVSRDCDWIGKDITQVYLEALTDANFHTLRRTVVRAINKETGWDLEENG